MTDATEPDESMNELVDALRAEVLSDAEDAPTTDVADDLISLVALADVSTDVALALDDLLVEDDTISGTLHSRLVRRVREDIDRRASAPVYLEQVVRDERERQSLSVNDLASRIDTSPATVEAIETAEQGFDGLSEEVVAAWIDELHLDLDMAAAALEASLLQPAAAYQGAEGRRTKKQVPEFVQKVRDVVVARRGQTS
jgi:transcriptional regulator with XRE-family HTH domain